MVRVQKCAVERRKQQANDTLHPTPLITLSAFSEAPLSISSCAISLWPHTASCRGVRDWWHQVCVWGASGKQGQHHPSTTAPQHRHVTSPSQRRCTGQATTPRSTKILLQGGRQGGCNGGEGINVCCTAETTSKRHPPPHPSSQYPAFCHIR